MKPSRANDFIPALHNFHISFTGIAKEDWTNAWKTQSRTRIIRLIARSIY